MKYQEVNKPKKIEEGQLRVWHMPQLPCPAFHVYVSTLKQAKLILETLAIYDLFQLKNKIKPDYSNAQGLEVYENMELGFIFLQKNLKYGGKMKTIMFKADDYEIQTLIDLLKEEISRNGDDYLDTNKACENILKQIEHRGKK